MGMTPEERAQATIDEARNSERHYREIVADAIRTAVAEERAAAEERIKEVAEALGATVVRFGAGTRREKQIIMLPAAK